MSYPFETLAHNPDHHDEINEEYKKSLGILNSIFDNPMTTQNIIDQGLTHLSRVNQYVSSDVNNDVKNTLQMLVKHLPQSPSGHYGDCGATVHGKAVFLDTFNALTNPENVFDHMANGTATANQVVTLREHYPSLWQEYQTTSLNDLMTSEEQGPEYRLAMYGYTGIETHPNVSASALWQRAQAQITSSSNQQMSGQQAQARQTRTAEKTPKTSPPKEQMSTMFSEPFTSPSGRMP